MKVEYKYFIILMTMASIVSILVLHNAHKENNNYTLDTNKINNQYINVNDFGIYLQNKDNKSQYVKQESNDYPTSGYVLNVDKTTCYDYHGKEVTGKVSQTDEGRVRLETTVSIYCQMYFDIDDEAPTIDSFTISGTDISGNSMVDYTYGTTIKYTVTWSAEDVVSYCITDSVIMST